MGEDLILADCNRFWLGSHTVLADKVKQNMRQIKGFSQKNYP